MAKQNKLDQADMDRVAIDWYDPSNEPQEQINEAATFHQQAQSMEDELVRRRWEVSQEEQDRWLETMRQMEDDGLRIALESHEVSTRATGKSGEDNAAALDRFLVGVKGMLGRLWANSEDESMGPKL